MKRSMLTAAVASLGLTSVLLAVPAGAEGSSTARKATENVDWASCPSGDPALNDAECADLTVPMDYGKPNGTKISIAISRVKHTVPDSEY